MPRGFSTLAPPFWQARFSTLYGNHSKLCSPAFSLYPFAATLPHAAFLSQTTSLPSSQHANHHKKTTTSLLLFLPAPSFLSPIPFPRAPFTPLHLLPPPLSQYFSKPTPLAKFSATKNPQPHTENNFILDYLPIITDNEPHLLIFINIYK